VQLQVRDRLTYASHRSSSSKLGQDHLLCPHPDEHRRQVVMGSAESLVDVVDYVVDVLDANRQPDHLR
jgi:hypothetical protein